MIINISELLSATEKKEHYTVPLEKDDFRIQGRRYPIISKSPVEIDIINQGERKICVDAKVSLVVDIPCDRCLEDVSTKFEFDIHKELDLNESDEDRVRDMDETSYVEHSSLDVDLMVYNEMLIHFPMKTLCKEDCKGLCPKCGHNLNLGECGCDRESLDPRMAAIRDIFNNFKEV
ncbi:MAG TPA: DUF177 domain-containing protein [Candidatus Scybalocola faecipullorum]|nr:DUF177 domain-containing protein [Candidatus Scybalocola faecipullorum]